MEQPAHGDQLSQILAKLTEQSERMTRQEQFVTQQNEAIAVQTETLERLRKENQELHQKINAIADKQVYSRNGKYSKLWWIHSCASFS